MHKQSSRNSSVLSDMTNKIFASFAKDWHKIGILHYKLMRTDIFITRTTKPICNLVNPGDIWLFLLDVHCTCFETQQIVLMYLFTSVLFITSTFVPVVRFLLIIDYKCTWYICNRGMIFDIQWNLVISRSDISWMTLSNNIIVVVFSSFCLE